MADTSGGRSSFTCKDEPIENQRPLKVRVIGAGLSGVYLGIRIPQRLRNIDLRIYEKNDGLGGTWWENNYPGCACDIPGRCQGSTVPMYSEVCKLLTPNSLRPKSTLIPVHI